MSNGANLEERLRFMKIDGTTRRNIPDIQADQMRELPAALDTF